MVCTVAGGDGGRVGEAVVYETKAKNRHEGKAGTAVLSTGRLSGSLCSSAR